MAPTNQVSVAMCPDRKLQWFVDNGWELDDVIRIRQTVVALFEEKFKPRTPEPPMSVPTLLPRRSVPGVVCFDVYGPFVRLTNSHRVQIDGAESELCKVFLRALWPLLWTASRSTYQQHHSCSPRTQQFSSIGTMSML